MLVCLGVVLLVFGEVVLDIVVITLFVDDW